MGESNGSVSWKFCDFPEFLTLSDIFGRIESKNDQTTCYYILMRPILVDLALKNAHCADIAHCALGDLNFDPISLNHCQDTSEHFTFHRPCYHMNSSSSPMTTDVLRSCFFKTRAPSIPSMRSFAASS